MLLRKLLSMSTIENQRGGEVQCISSSAEPERKKKEKIIENIKRLAENGKYNFGVAAGSTDFKVRNTQ